MKILTLCFFFSYFMIFCDELVIDNQVKDGKIIYEVKKVQTAKKNDKFEKPKLKLGKRIESSEEKKILQEKKEVLLKEYNSLKAEKQRLILENEKYEKKLKNL